MMKSYGRARQRQRLRPSPVPGEHGDESKEHGRGQQPKLTARAQRGRRPSRP